MLVLSFIAVLSAGDCPGDLPTIGASAVITINIETNGSDLPVDTYVVVLQWFDRTDPDTTLLEETTREVFHNGGFNFEVQSYHPYRYFLEGITDNCDAEVDDQPAAGGSGSVLIKPAHEVVGHEQYEVTIACHANRVEVTTVTTGSDLDPDGYQVILDGVPTNIWVNDTERQSIEINGTGTLKYVRGDWPYLVGLTDLDLACDVTNGANPREVTTELDRTVDITFEVTCGGNGGAAGRIAFESDRDGNKEIYVMDADGSGAQRLTNDPAGDVEASWSPDGTQIVFVSWRDGDDEIYVMNADGSSETQLTDNTAHDWNPAWSPDGRIAFRSVRDGNSEIYVMNADGSGVTRLTDNPATDAKPTWSHDGSYIAFVSDRDGNDEIYVMNADGSGQTNVTLNAASDVEPAWSPVGDRIAFASDRDGNEEIYVMNADGSGQTRVTLNSAEDDEPTWSPDAAHIAFTSDRDGNEEIYVMNADGSGQTNVTRNSAEDDEAAWTG